MELPPFEIDKPLIVTLHLPPLPGSPGYNGDIDGLLEYAVEEAKAIESSGADGILIENYGDKPYLKIVNDPFTISTISVIVRDITKTVNIPVGVNILRNSAIEAYAVAYVNKAEFVRVNAYADTLLTESGVVEALAPKLERVRARYPGVYIYADILCKHSIPLNLIGISYLPLEKVVRFSVDSAVNRGKADAIILTGSKTGEPPSLDYVKLVKDIVGDKYPIIIGSGINHKNIKIFSKFSKGFIVGTSVKIDGKTENPIDIRKLKHLIKVLKELRSMTKR